MKVENPGTEVKQSMMDQLPKCSACGSGICLAQSKAKGRLNYCFTLRRNREEEKTCPTCNTKVPASSIQKVKGGR